MKAELVTRCSEKFSCWYSPSVISKGVCCRIQMSTLQSQNHEYKLWNIECFQTTSPWNTPKKMNNRECEGLYGKRTKLIFSLNYSWGSAPFADVTFSSSLFLILSLLCSFSRLSCFSKSMSNWYKELHFSLDATHCKCHKS